MEAIKYFSENLSERTGNGLPPLTLEHWWTAVVNIYFKRQRLI